MLLQTALLCDYALKHIVLSRSLPLIELSDIILSFLPSCKAVDNIDNDPHLRGGQHLLCHWLYSRMFALPCEYDTREDAYSGQVRPALAVTCPTERYLVVSHDGRWKTAPHQVAVADQNSK